MVGIGGVVGSHAGTAPAVGTFPTPCPFVAAFIRAHAEYEDLVAG